MQVHYLEIVTPNPDAICGKLAAQHGVTFADPEAMLGGSRVAELSNGGRIGVRAPIGPEQPAMRPYLLVADIEAASKAAEAAGAEFAMHATEIPGQGFFAIYFLDGLEYGLWQL